MTRRRASNTMTRRRHPIQWQEEGHPIQWQEEGHPIQWREEGHPIQWQEEGHPIQWQEEGHPIQWQEEKGQKWQTMIYKTLHRKLKIEQHEPTKNRGELEYSGSVSRSYSISGTRCVTHVTNPLISHEWEKTVLWLRLT